MEIIQERLEREFNLALITTAPGVRYRVNTSHGTQIEISSPAQLPDLARIESIEEPYILATIVTRDEYVGGILALVAGPARHPAGSLQYVCLGRAS